MLPLRKMKMQWTLNEFISLDEQFQYKVKSPDTGMCKKVSIDTASIQDFQNYMRNFDFRVMRYVFNIFVCIVDAMAVQYWYDLSIQPCFRVGFLYGKYNEDTSVKVEFIYEPPQETTDISFTILPDEKEVGSESVTPLSV